jgi:hypothetical protein
MPNGTKRTAIARRHNRRAGAFAGASRLSRANPSRHQADTLANAKRSYDRYIELARAAVSAGDAIEAENLYQHAEHHLRTMREHAAKE